MSQWKEITLGDQISYKKGFAFKSKDLNSNENIPVVKLTNTIDRKIDISSCDKVNNILASSLKDYTLQYNDVIIATVGSWPSNPLSVVGKIIRVDEFAIGALLNQNAVRLRANSDFNQSFLFYLLCSNLFQDYIISTAQGSANQASITLKDIFSFSYKSPSLQEQERIAEVLSSLDDKIDLLKKQNKTLEEMAETLFRKWFVEEAKEEWEIGVLGDFVNIVYGKNLPTKNLLQVGYPVFGGNGQIGFYDRYIYDDPQILISCRGEASGVVNISLKKSFVTNNSLVLEIGKRPELTFEFLKYKALQTDYKIYVTGSAQPQITIEGLYPAEFILPAKDLIIKFSNIVHEWELKRTNNQLQINQLEILRDTLLPKLMSGQVKCLI